MMKGLNLKVHNRFLVSIMDLNKDLDLNDDKWKRLISYYVDETDVVYFYAIRLNYLNADLKQNIELISDEMLINKDSGYNIILFKVKLANLIVNLNLLNKIWKAYESPSLIFSKKEENQEHIRTSLIDQIYYPNLLQNVPGLIIFYQDIEQDVLWINANEDVSVAISNLYK